MECVIPKRSVRIFSKVIQCLAKVGDDLFLEASDQKLVFRTLNQARSAFVAVTFTMNFFESFSLSADMLTRCKIQLKPCLAVFRSTSTVEKCTMRLDEAESKLIVHLLCKLGIKKTFKLAFEESETIQAVYSKENCPNKIVSRPRLLLDVVGNFHSNLDEISFIVYEKHLVVKSYVGQEKRSGVNKPLHTELTVDSREFEEYMVTGDIGEITFCLKELKALLSFCEVAGQQIALWFEKGGRPILFTVNVFNCFEVDFVLATLLEPVTSGSQSSSASESSQSQSGSQRPPPSYSTSGTQSTPPSSSESVSSYPPSVAGGAAVPGTPPSSIHNSSGSSQPHSSYSHHHRHHHHHESSIHPSSSQELLAGGGAAAIPDSTITSSMVDAAVGLHSSPSVVGKKGVLHGSRGGKMEVVDTKIGIKLMDEEEEEEEGSDEDSSVEGTPPSSPPPSRRGRA
ncbi:Cell cycle checkpoint control protein rad9b [Balamuthia mandrillaris]